MGAPRLLAPTTISGGIPTAGAGTLNTVALWTPDGFTLGDSVLTQAGTTITNASGAIRATGTSAGAPAFTGSDTDTGIYFPANNQMRFSTAGSPAMSIDASQQVGIGTTSPASAMHVRNNTAGITLDSTLGSGRQYQLNPLRTGVSNAGFEIRDVTAGAAVISIDASQQVGIGTANPTAKTTIYKANNGLGAWNALDLSVDGLSLNDAVYQRWYAASVSATVGRFGMSFAAGVASFVWNSVYNSTPQTAELMRLTGGGYLGIGTASPAATLHVARNGSTDPAIIGSGTNSAVGNFESSDFGRANRWTFGRDNSLTGNFVVAYNGSTLTSTTSTGFVGIGTANPQEKTQVFGNLKVGVYASGSFISLGDEGTTQKNVGIFRGASVNELQLGGYGGIIFNAGAAQLGSQTERARIDSAGNFCIGTASAATANSRLTVVGGFIATASGFGVYQPGDHLTLSGGAGKNVHLKPNDGGVLAVNVGATSCDMSAVSGYGLKLPATPGNADTQTLDCYQENTWTPTRAGFGGTNPTVTASYTRVGRLVTIAVTLTATGGNQYSGALGTTTLTVPSGMTPSVTASSTMTNGAVANVGNVAAFSDGFIYLPTFGLTTATHQFTITYSV